MDREVILEKVESTVKYTIDKYDLLNKKDKVVVCCSGGKDSTTVLYLLNKWGYRTEALIVDLLIGEWSKKNLENLSNICYLRSCIQSRTRLKNCMICGVIKRWLLNKAARELGATKLATGHNLDDEAETLVMNLCGGNFKLSVGLGPKTGARENVLFVQRIKPLYFCSNDDIKQYSKIMGFPVLYEPCPCSVNSFRRHIGNALADLERKNPGTKRAIVENFLKLLSHLKKAYCSNDELKLCKICNEPTRNEICKMCELLMKVVINSNGKGIERMQKVKR